MEVKKDNKEQLTRVVNILAQALERISVLERDVELLKADKELADSGIYFEGSEEYKKHIFSEEGE